MAEISKITLPSGTTYDIKDTIARQMASGVIHLVPGENETPLTDGATTNPIIVDGKSYTAVSGDAVFYESKEYVYDGSIWHEFGDLTGLKALAYKDSASTNYTPQGTVSKPSFAGEQASISVKGTPSGSIEISSGSGTANYTPEGTVSTPTFTGESLSSTGKFTPEGEVSKPSFTGDVLSSTGKFTPEGAVSKPSFTGDVLSSTGKFTPVGSVSTPTISVKTSGTTTTINSIESVGTLPSLSTTVENENLTISFNQGTLPVKGENTTVKTGDAEYQSTQPTFTGTEGDLNVSGTPTGSVSQPVFTGSEGNLNVSGTPTGIVSQPVFTGLEGNLSVSGTPTGTISQPTFTGTGTALTASFTGDELTSAGTYTPEGTVSQPTFTGDTATITVS